MWVAGGASAAQALAALLGGTADLPDGSTEWLTVLAMGVLTAGAFGGLFLGVLRLGALRTAIVASLEPVFAAVLALVFLAEGLRPGVLLGGLLILAGAVAATLARGVRKPGTAGP
jgi:drug/metabolite transporter (DMT)-like permease